MAADPQTHRFKAGRFNRADADALNQLRDELFRDGRVVVDYPLLMHGDGQGTTFIGLDVAAVSTALNAIPTASGTLIATSGGTTTLTGSSDLPVTVIAGSSPGQTIILPDATTVGNGYQIPIINQSSSTITVKDSQGNILYFVPPYSYLLLTLGSNSTAAGNWLIGVYPLYYGLPTAQIATTGGTTTLTATSLPAINFTGSANQTLVLPNATTLQTGQVYDITNSSTGLITVNLNGGSTLATIPAGGSLNATLVNNGTSAGSWSQFSNTSTGLNPLNVRLTADVTENAGTLKNLSDLSVTLTGGKSYTGRFVCKCNDSLAADGIKFDFGGGSASMTSFWAAASVFYSGGTDTAVNLLGTALGALYNWSTITNETVIVIEITMQVNIGGTFIPRFAQNVHTSGTATAEKDSYLMLTPTSN